MPSTEQLATLLVAMGCPADRSFEMATQLENRSHQLAAQKNKTTEEALGHLLNLMRQGWAATEKGL